MSIEIILLFKEELEEAIEKGTKHIENNQTYMKQVENIYFRGKTVMRFKIPLDKVESSP